MTQLPPNLLIGTDKRLYVEKTVGPADRPIFKAVLPASEADLPQNRVAGPTLEMLNFPKLSMRDLTFVHAYFAAIYQKYSSEAIVLFHRGPTDTEYTVVVPESYSATGTSLTYEHSQPTFCTTCRVCSTEVLTQCPRCGTNTMTRTIIMGTAHSHGNMSAFHSGTDDAHEKNQTGFHITFGNVNQGLYSICPSFVVALAGYTDASGFGTRYYPKLEELLAVPDPLSQAEQTMIELWTTVLFNEQMLRALPDAQSVVLEEGRAYPCFTSINADYAEHWKSLQPTTRKLHVLTISKVKEILSQRTSTSSSRSGSSTTRLQDRRTPHTSTGRQLVQVGRPATATGSNVGMTTTPGQITPATTDGKGSTKLTEQSDDSNFLDFKAFSAKYPAFGLNVDVDVDGEITVTDTDEPLPNQDWDPWGNINAISKGEFSKGVFVTWTLIYLLQEIANRVDIVVPKKTGGLPKAFDEAMESVVKTIHDRVGDCTLAAESFLGDYTVRLDYKSEPTTLIDAIKIPLECVTRVIDASEYEFHDDSSIINSIGSFFLLLYLLEDALDVANNFKALDSDSVDEIEDGIRKVKEELFKRAHEFYEDQAKESAPSTTP